MKNLDVERGLLAAFLSRPELLDDFIEKIHIDLFTDKVHRDIYKLIEEMYQDKGKITRTQILVFLREKGHEDYMDLISGSGYILPDEAEDLIELLNNCYNQRVLRAGLNRAYEFIEDTNLTVEERNSRVQDVIFELTNGFRSGKLIYNA